jgi:hypothetical protein
LKRESRLEPVLSTIEFPGEEESLIRAWLDSRDFADGVMRKSRRLRVISHHTVMWGSSLIAVTAVGIVATSTPVLGAVGGSVALFACLLFGVLTTTTVVGLLATLHPSWWSRREPRSQPGTRTSADPPVRRGRSRRSDTRPGS